MVKLLVRKILAQRLVTEKQIKVKRACQLISLSRSCYYYQSKLQSENDLIANWLLKLTQWQKNW